MKRFLLFFTLLLVSVSFLAAQSASLSGNVSEEDTKEPVLFGSVALYQNGVLKSGTETDFDGNYNFSNLDPGTYDIEFGYLGYQTKRIEGVKVFAGKSIKLDAELSVEGVTLAQVVIVAYKVPLVEQDNTTQGGTLTSDQIKNLPTRNINALAATTAGLSSADEGDDVSIRGSRDDATNYYVDGMRVSGNLIPESEIDQLQVITGGVEARYGDVTGGIISITTKGPSSKFSGGVEVETSQMLDPYNNNLVGINLSGPLLRNKEGQSILGFRLSGRYTYNEDDDPSAVPVYRVKDDVLAELEANPIITKGGNTFTAADFLTNEDVDALEVRPFEDLTRYDLTAKIDARFSEAIDVTLTGSLSQEEDFFTPSENSENFESWRTFNSHNNPIDLQDVYRVNFRFRHRLGGANTGEGDDRKVSTIQNASYVLQGSYQKRIRNINDPVHDTNYFNHGYVGKFDVDNIPVFAASADTAGNIILTHVDYRQVLRGYDTSNSPNPVLANYNNTFNLSTNEMLNPLQPNYAIQNVFGENPNVTIDNLYAINGRVSDIYDNSWGFHRNVGGVYNRSVSRDNDIISFNANASFDLVPGGSESGRHNIQLGIAYEDRTNRDYDVRDPRKLWLAARQNANAHIQGIDAENADVLGLYSELYPDQPSIIAPWNDAEILSLTLSNDPDARFYKAVRESLGVGLGEYVNTDGLTPDQLSFDMFSAQELNDQFILDYYGYDYLGNEYDGTFDDFFTARDPDGIRAFPVAPSRPLYTSVFIQDKFTFRDIIFRLGVRMDRYDANTKVLQDPYSLYAIQGANDFHSQNGGERPGNIGDDFSVYTTVDDGAEVQAYRDVDDWYHADGTPANSSTEIEGIRTGLVFPKYQSPNAHTANYIKSEDFNTDASFKDYEVQVSIMPRLAFSFPISDKANFFAHYDILVQRPPSNTIATALDYFYFTERIGTETFNNPDLRPERTVDYEVGFQQALSTSSAIKISAYYKEMRDMIQLRTFFPVPIVGSYTTFDNQDFGTVKGFSFGYDLRRTRNITINANYTLQFADGTGSDSESARGLTNRGNIRTLFPLSFDERHRFNLIADYRFPKESGPRIAGAYILANSGFNFQAVAVSGRPYTAKVTPTELGGDGTFGAIHGSRKPFTSTLNMRFDKNFDLGNKLGLNIYIRISNLLDTRNIIDVYEVTGDPEDDGFLRSSFGQDQIRTIGSSARDVEAYLASYQWRLLNSDYFSLPRRIFVGASLDF